MQFTSQQDKQGAVHFFAGNRELDAVKSQWVQRLAHNATQPVQFDPKAAAFFVVGRDVHTGKETRLAIQQQGIELVNPVYADGQRNSPFQKVAEERRRRRSADSNASDADSESEADEAPVAKLAARAFPQTLRTGTTIADRPKQAAPAEGAAVMADKDKDNAKSGGLWATVFWALNLPFDALSWLGKTVWDYTGGWAMSKMRSTQADTTPTAENKKADADNNGAMTAVAAAILPAARNAAAATRDCAAACETAARAEHQHHSRHRAH